MGQKNHLVGGLEHLDYFSITYGMSSFPLTHIFQDGYCTTNQSSLGLKFFDDASMRAFQVRLGGSRLGPEELS